jgi:hypothetical protein
VISHASSDHIGGLLDPDGHLAFPKARYLIARVEWDYWSAGAPGWPYDPYTLEFFLARSARFPADRPAGPAPGRRPRGRTGSPDPQRARTHPRAPRAEPAIGPRAAAQHRRCLRPLRPVAAPPRVALRRRHRPRDELPDAPSPARGGDRPPHVDVRVPLPVSRHRRGDPPPGRRLRHRHAPCPLNHPARTAAAGTTRHGAAARRRRQGRQRFPLSSRRDPGGRSPSPPRGRVRSVRCVVVAGRNLTRSAEPVGSDRAPGGAARKRLADRAGASLATGRRNGRTGEAQLAAAHCSGSGARVQ